jgi:hypothetical protein
VGSGSRPEASRSGPRRMPEGELRRLVYGIGATIGIEALVWLTDMGGLSRGEAAEVMCSNAHAAAFRARATRLSGWRAANNAPQTPTPCRRSPKTCRCRYSAVPDAVLRAGFGAKTASRPVVGVGDVVKPVLSLRFNPNGS